MNKLLILWDFIKRHGTYFLIGFVALYVLGFEWEFVHAIMMTLTIVCLGIGVACLAVFAFTKYKFIHTDDGLTIPEAIVISIIFLSCLLVTYELMNIFYLITFKP